VASPDWSGRVSVQRIIPCTWSNLLTVTVHHVSSFIGPSGPHSVIRTTLHEYVHQRSQTALHWTSLLNEGYHCQTITEDYCCYHWRSGGRRTAPGGNQAGAAKIGGKTTKMWVMDH